MKKSLAAVVLLFCLSSAGSAAQTKDEFLEEHFGPDFLQTFNPDHQKDAELAEIYALIKFTGNPSTEQATVKEVREFLKGLMAKTVNDKLLPPKPAAPPAAQR